MNARRTLSRRMRACRGGKPPGRREVMARGEGGEACSGPWTTVDVSSDRVRGGGAHGTTRWPCSACDQALGQSEVRVKHFAAPHEVCRPCRRHAQCVTDERAHSLPGDGLPGLTAGQGALTPSHRARMPAKGFCGWHSSREVWRRFSAGADRCRVPGTAQRRRQPTSYPEE